MPDESIPDESSSDESIPDDGPASDDGPVARRWFRFGVGFAVFYAFATVVAVVLLRVDRTIGVALVVAGSTLGSWLLVYYFVSVLD